MWGFRIRMNSKPPAKPVSPNSDQDLIEQARKTQHSAKESALELLQLVRLLAPGKRDRVDEVYRFLGTHNQFGRRTLYLNLGFWKDANTYDDACEALATELGRFGKLQAGLTILDAGFGFGDQHLLWMKQHALSRIHGFNLSPEQVELAQKRIRLAGLEDRVCLTLGSALETDLPDASVDRVFALESGFHFDTREDFFKEAFRVLKPGGILAMADLAPKEAQKESGLFEKIVGGAGRRLWQVPPENLYPPSQFGPKLLSVGFQDPEVRLISDHVFRPFKEYARAHQSDPEIVSRTNPLLRLAWKMPTVERSPLEYFLVRAQKPLN